MLQASSLASRNLIDAVGVSLIAAFVECRMGVLLTKDSCSDIFLKYRNVIPIVTIIHGILSKKFGIRDYTKRKPIHNRLGGCKLF